MMMQFYWAAVDLPTSHPTPFSFIYLTHLNVLLHNNPKTTQLRGHAYEMSLSHGGKNNLVETRPMGIIKLSTLMHSSKKKCQRKHSNPL